MKPSSRLTWLTQIGSLASVLGLLHGGTVALNPIPPANDSSKGPPLPLHQIEGSGGVLTTLSAHLVNPPRQGELLGRPALGAAYVGLGHGRNLTSLTLTESPFSRLELGYAYERFDLGDLPLAVHAATGLRIDTSTVQVHNLNARFSILREGDFDLPWLPALTAGVHWKYNQDIHSINNDLLGTLRGLGIRRNQGLDSTLYATRAFQVGSHPVVLSAGLRLTKSAHTGFLGFTDSYTVQPEFNVCIGLTDRLLLGLEYRAKPNQYTRIPGLIEKEDDWYTVALAYIVNDHVSVAVGWGHFGNVLNHKANASFGFTVKTEF